MSYPDLPENRLIVNGVDLAVRYNMVLLDGYTLSPPEPKTTTVEIPGRDGVLDLTESLIGDVTYNNRSMTFTFLIVDLEQFEVVKTQVHGSGVYLHRTIQDHQLHPYGYVESRDLWVYRGRDRR